MMVWKTCEKDGYPMIGTVILYQTKIMKQLLVGVVRQNPYFGNLEVLDLSDRWLQEAYGTNSEDIEDGFLTFNYIDAWMEAPERYGGGEWTDEAD